MLFYPQFRVIELISKEDPNKMVYTLMQLKHNEESEEDIPEINLELVKTSDDIFEIVAEIKKNSGRMVTRVEFTFCRGA